MNWGYELDESKQFQLGANSGLRGYDARQFTGERLFLMNLEDRQFWGTFDLGMEFSLGTVLFIDTGNVWKEEDDISLDDLNWSAGFGLRLAMMNLPKEPILRLDLGWALSDTGDFAVTVGTEQHF